MTTHVGATGLYSLNPVIWGFFGTGMMVERWKHERTLHSASYLLKICVKTGGLLDSTGFSGRLGAFLLFFFLKTWRTSSSFICRCGERGVAVFMDVWAGVQSGCGVFFQTCNRTH